mgnify:CR=1 FL=1
MTDVTLAWEERAGMRLRAPEPRFCLLGPLLVRQDGTEVPIPAGKQRVLLAALLLNPGRAMTADELAELLWEAGPPASARETVHNYVKRLRQALGDTDRTLVTTQADGYQLRVCADEVDILRFEAMTGEARQALRAGHGGQAADRLREALALWRGKPLADVPCEHLLVRHGPRLEEMRLQALEARIEADLECGRPADVIAELRALVAAEPLRERLHALLMVALYRDGRQSDALAAFREARRVLVDEVGVEPGAELQRLHQQVLDGDPALNGSPATPAEHPVPVVPRQLPAAMAHFVGREAELARLDELQAGPGGSSPGRPGTTGTTGDAVVIAAIGGTAGVGKSALAVHWAHRAADRFPDGQLYVNLHGFGPGGTPMAAAEALGGFLEALDPAVAIPAGLDARVGLYRSLTAGQRLLVILDNARDADQVRPLLPGSPGCMVLITSRDRLTGLAATEGAPLLSLEVLAEAEASELVVARAGVRRETADPAAVAEITELCGRLPLALAVAGAKAAARPALSLAELAAELRDTRDRLDALDAGDESASARAVFSWSYATLSPPAARMFRLLGLHPGPDIGVSAAASLAGASLPQARGLLDELARSHVASEPAVGRFGLHDLLRAYARERVEADENAAEARAACRRMVDYYLHAAYATSRLLYPPRDVTLAPAQPGVLHERLASYEQAWSWTETEYPVLLAMVALAAEAGFPRHAWQIAWSLETFLSRRGRWDELARIELIALDAAEQGGDKAGQAHAHCGLGWANVLLGRYDEAHAHLGQAVQRFRRLGDASWEARAQVRAGQAFWQQARYSDAHESCQRALELFRVSGHRAGQAGALNNIGLYHIQLGEYQRGVDFCQQGLDIFLALGYSRGAANTLDSLGEAYHGLGRTADALDSYRQSLSAFRELGDRYQQATILTHLATVYQSSGDDRAAADALEEALAILTELKHREAGPVEARLREILAVPPRRHLLAVGSQGWRRAQSGQALTRAHAPQGS